MKRMIVWLAALALAVGLGLVVPGSASAAAPYCGIAWGSLPKSAPTVRAGTLEDVRAGQHECFDRLVIDVQGDAPGYVVEYGPVSTEGKGDPVPLRGAADLRIVVKAPAYDAHGHATYQPADRAELVDVTGYGTFRQVAWAGTSEGQSTVGLGVRARLPFRVFVLDGPGNHSRVVVDVAHRW